MLTTPLHLATISTFSLGTLGHSIWYMGVKDSFLTIIFANLLCNIPVAYFSTFGPKSGMRQLTLTRFSFGYYTVMIPVLLNALACIGKSQRFCHNPDVSDYRNKYRLVHRQCHCWWSSIACCSYRQQSPQNAHRGCDRHHCRLDLLVQLHGVRRALCWSL